MPQVAVVMGSKSDADVMKGTTDVLDAMGITYEVVTISAHRTPEKVRQYGLSARERGIEVIIAGAGYAAALPGVLAGWTDLPVIGVPLASSDLNGVDSLYAIVHMPSGIPVAAMTIGATGDKNAGYMAAAILSLKYDKIREAYVSYRKSLQGDSK